MPQTKETDNLLSIWQQDAEILLRNTASLTVVFAPGGKILAANVAAARILGYTTDQLFGKNILKIFKFDATPFEIHTLQAAESQPFQETYQGRMLSGILVPILDVQGNLVRVALLAEDHTDRLRFEEIQDNREKLRALLQKLLSLQEDQFQRLGRELHDHIGQDLTAININISLIERMLPENYPEDLRARLTSANQLVEDAVAHMRSVMADFVPPMLDRYGLAAALLWYGQKITRRTNMPVRVNDGGLHDTRLPKQVEIALFRIAQEALNNTASHTQASEAEIELEDEAGSILMIVADNGAGFDPQTVSVNGDQHLGLEMMRERARAIGASFEIKSAPGSGTKVIVRIQGKP